MSARNMVDHKFKPKVPHRLLQILFLIMKRELFCWTVISDQSNLNNMTKNVMIMQLKVVHFWVMNGFFPLCHHILILQLEKRVGGWFLYLITSLCTYWVFKIYWYTVDKHALYLCVITSRYLLNSCTLIEDELFPFTYLCLCVLI